MDHVGNAWGYANMWSGRIWTKTLGEICYRVGTALEAGIDIRRSLEREAERTTGATGRQMSFIRDQVAKGSSLSDALEQTGTFFPRLFQPMVRVGESTGRLGQILLKLSEYYAQIVQARRQLMRSITWPLLELGLTLLIVALLIMLPVMLPRMPDGQLQDMLGWGLVGYSGITVYLMVLGLIAFLMVMILESFRRDTALARFIMSLWERLPFVGHPLTELALGRVAWSLSLTTNTAMPLQESVALALDASLLPRLSNLTHHVQQRITRGNELHAALRETHQLPPDFLDVVEVGEETGNLPEAMERLSHSYDERARHAIQRLSVIVGVIVWCGVAILIISLIFRLYGNYMRTLQGLM